MSYKDSDTMTAFVSLSPACLMQAVMNHLMNTLPAAPQQQQQQRKQGGPAQQQKRKKKQRQQQSDGAADMQD
jgi:hypothetical protein